MCIRDRGIRKLDSVRGTVTIDSILTTSDSAYSKADLNSETLEKTEEDIAGPVSYTHLNRHQVFIEPEGLYTNEMYVGGMSSSLPEDVQDAMYHSVPGLENAKIVKNAYAIEYDCINPRQLYPTLEFKNIKGLFSAGQFNGSSGYEEAAAQGLIAGINAALKLKGKEMLVLDRSEAYIGVLSDDLVTKENHCLLYTSYLFMTPLQIKQQKFSKLSSVMQPELMKIQKKYQNKKDQVSMQKMQEETSAVYQKYGVSPTGSCVQLLIQMCIRDSFLLQA